MLRSKEFWMDFAEIMDANRVFPRILIAAYGVLIGWEVTNLQVWYEHLQPAARTVEVTAFYSMLMGGMFGLATYIFKVYSDGGFDWDAYHRRKQCQSSLPPSAPP